MSIDNFVPYCDPGVGTRIAHERVAPLRRRRKTMYEPANSAAERDLNSKPMRSIPIDVIRAFVAVVEARGFTRAAEDLGRSQPTISLQVKRLEELVEAPLFEKVARFELTAVGAVCFDYGKQLLRLHDEMLDEAQRRKAPDQRLRIGMPGELCQRLVPQLNRLLAARSAAAGFEVATGEAETLGKALSQNDLDVVFLVAAEAEPEACGRWRAPLAWFASAGAERSANPLRLVLPPSGSTIHEAAVGALRAADRPFEIICASFDFAVQTAAVSAGLGIAPMIDGLQPDGLIRSSDPSLPALPPLVLSLVARNETLAEAAGRWAARLLSSFQAL